MERKKIAGPASFIEEFRIIAWRIRVKVQPAGADSEPRTGLELRTGSEPRTTSEPRMLLCHWFRVAAEILNTPTFPEFWYW